MFEECGATLSMCNRVGGTYTTTQKKKPVFFWATRNLCNRTLMVLYQILSSSDLLPKTDGAKKKTGHIGGAMP